MQVPEFWRGPDNRLYRIRREQRPLEDVDGQLYTVRAFSMNEPVAPAAEASVALRRSDLLEMARLNQQVPSPEQLFLEAFRQVMSRLGASA
jgi:hypothetical protein